MFIIEDNNNDDHHEWSYKTDDIKTTMMTWERISISDVVVLPKLRGSLDRRKGTSPQLRGRAYYDSQYFEVNKSTIDKCSWSCKQKAWEYLRMYLVLTKKWKKNKASNILYINNLMMKATSGLLRTLKACVYLYIYIWKFIVD